MGGWSPQHEKVPKCAQAPVRTFGVHDQPAGMLIPTIQVLSCYVNLAIYFLVYVQIITNYYFIDFSLRPILILPLHPVSTEH